MKFWHLSGGLSILFAVGTLLLTLLYCLGLTHAEHAHQLIGIMFIVTIITLILSGVAKSTGDGDF